MVASIRGWLEETGRFQVGGELYIIQCILAVY